MRSVRVANYCITYSHLQLVLYFSALYPIVVEMLQQAEYVTLKWLKKMIMSPVFFLFSHNADLVRVHVVVTALVTYTY